MQVQYILRDGTLGTKDAKTYIECVTKEDSQQLLLIEDNLIQAFQPLIVMHIICVVCLLIMHLVTALNKNSYFYSFLVVITLPIYQFAIFEALDEVR